MFRERVRRAATGKDSLEEAAQQYLSAELGASASTESQAVRKAGHQFLEQCRAAVVENPGGAKGALLGLCDSIRDDVLPSLGINTVHFQTVWVRDIGRAGVKLTDGGFGSELEMQGPVWQVMFY